MKKIIILILFLFLLTGCNSSYKKERKEFKEEYGYFSSKENIPSSWDWFSYDEFSTYLESEVFVSLNFNSLKKLIESNSKIVVYYGFNPLYYQCPYCVSAIPSMVLVANELNIDIFYLDIYEDRTNVTENYLYLYNMLKDTFPDFPEKIFVPTVVVYENKVPTGYHVSTIKNEFDESIKGLNEEQKITLKDIYKNLYEK